MIDIAILTTIGNEEANIPVSISYRIIELFSAGLYSSPNKAIEELVANSYDAMATHVHIIIPDNLETIDATIWVMDNGISMNLDGLFNLWRIASSNKRSAEYEARDRRPIGKFGIGKLATYVLARQLTYICKSNGEFRAVTMDYSKINPSLDADNQNQQLVVRKLTEPEARKLLDNVVRSDQEGYNAITLFGVNAAHNWTIAIMSGLTSLAQKLTPGRLRWVLSTALPLSPQFNMYFNGERLKSTKENLKPLMEWPIGGKGDRIAEKLNLAVIDEPPGVEIPGIGQVHGITSMFDEPLTGNKAEQWGRSHGIFVIVRGRLINIDDPLFGLPALSHGPFSRFRLEIHADGLDGVLRSTREAVLESEGVRNLRDYLNQKFNEARSWYANYLSNREYKAKLSTKISSTPLSLSRVPLLNAVKAVMDGIIPELTLIKVPLKLTTDEKLALVERLQTALISETGLIKDVRFEPLGAEGMLAVFDAEEGCLRVNLLHPFYANYEEHYQNHEPFELVAVAEVLTEAYMLEEGISYDSVRSVLLRRDRFLREIVFTRQLAAPLVVEYLRASIASADGLEEAVALALRSLGFEVSPIGGKGEPDGIAYARLGVRDELTGARSDYKITYDTKSTGKSRVQAHTVGSGTIFRHRKTYEAQYSLVIAPNFAAPEDGAIVTEAEQQQITLMTVEDLARLVLVAATRQLGFSRLRNLFENCRKPSDSRTWIDNILAEETSSGPLPQILDTIWDLMEESPDPVKFAAVALKLRLSKPGQPPYRELEIREWLQSLKRLAGGYITIDGDVVSLEAPPERILREVRYVSAKLPEQFRRQVMITTLISATNERLGD